MAEHQNEREENLFPQETAPSDAALVLGEAHSREDSAPPPPKTSKKKRILRRVIAAVVATLAGVSVAEVAAAVCAYDAFFPRYERPDYAITPGLYDYARLRDTLHREILWFESASATLCGYYYPVPRAKGLVVISHGFHAGADDYLPLVEALVAGGYAVFGYDVTGTYSSGGDSVVGMCQSLVDLDRALTFVKSSDFGKELPLFLLGHSWGGYAVTSVLALHSDVRACVALAPMNNGSTVMVEKGEQYVGKLAYASKPVFDVYQRILFGKYVEYDGVKGINSTDIPVLIAQGIDDTVITVDGQSITAHRGEITNPNVTYYFGRGSQGTHTGIWHSDAAAEYQRKVASDLRMLEMERGRELTVEEKTVFYQSVDHRLYSEVNEELMELIFDTLERALEQAPPV
jgi:pimeloyl-ACP methyl ester carboxylesterase